MNTIYYNPNNPPDRTLEFFVDPGTQKANHQLTLAQKLENVAPNNYCILSRVRMKLAPMSDYEIMFFSDEPNPISEPGQILNLSDEDKKLWQGSVSICTGHFGINHLADVFNLNMPAKTDSNDLWLLIQARSEVVFHSGEFVVDFWFNSLESQMKDEPAFPQLYDQLLGNGSEVRIPLQGLTKREYFAAMALQGYCSHAEIGLGSPKELAELAADAAESLLCELGDSDDN